MKRVCFSLLFSFSLFAAALPAQNLIPNPSVEDYIECPDGLGGTPPHDIEHWVVDWTNLRGSPDYFRSGCLPGLGWDNGLGYQEPRTGNGYLGAVLLHTGLPNAKESFGVQLIEPLVLGETYYCTFHVSMAFRADWVRLAVNRIGFLLMTENYLLPGEQAPTPNYATYEIPEIITDTSNWVEISTSFIADSAYTMIAFGVFYDVDSLLVTAPYTNESTGNAYYFFDDFCLTTNPEGCIFTTNIDGGNDPETFKVFPNPSSSQLSLRSRVEMTGYEIIDLQGRRVQKGLISELKEAELIINQLEGVYLLRITTKKGVQSRRVLIKPH